jgi:hypothetical protein
MMDLLGIGIVMMLIGLQCFELPWRFGAWLASKNAKD